MAPRPVRLQLIEAIRSCLDDSPPCEDGEDGVDLDDFIKSFDDTVGTAVERALTELEDLMRQAKEEAARTHGLLERAERVAITFKEARGVEARQRAVQLSLFNQCKLGEKVYFQTDGEFVKIGRTIRPEKARRKENQTGNPRVLTTLAVIPGASEAKLAALFTAHHLRGEWYRMAPEIMAFIRAWQMVEAAFS